MNDDIADRFEGHRSYLTGLAYRMLGTVSEAQDVVQDTYLRWHHAQHGEIDNARAYLTTVTSRLCLDRLKAARRCRELYIGPWLPEPLLDETETFTHESDLARDVSFALMLALERLSPLERAAFLLHDVFDMEFAEVAATLDRTEATCRQLASRARSHIVAARPRFRVTRGDGEKLAAAFFQASRHGDTTALSSLLAESAVLHTDGGGQRRAALRVIAGAEKICRFFAGIARKAPNSAPLWAKPLPVNSMPGWLTVELDGFPQVTAVDISGGRVAAVYVMRNPDKLLHVRRFVPEDMRFPARDVPVTQALQERRRR